MTEREFKKPEGLENYGEIKFVRPSQLARENFEGVVVEGTFVEALKNPFDDSKLDYKFETEEGGTVILNHAGGLAYQMAAVNPGTFCRVSYLGKKEITSGKMKGREAHNYEVLIA